ncbi:MAG: hypothetical protein K0S53_3009 [Bacteroidetes bacterium]|jgi:hypothetical protein|nr:hypothetical protein [Bacteroidota bacterium]MDF2452622.1 hypothetical protein [Bacteroidota bacterium]
MPDMLYYINIAFTYNYKISNKLSLCGEYLSKGPVTAELQNESQGSSFSF